MSDRFKKGNHWITDDRSGARIRASDARTEWTGAVVHKDDFEARHPQDFVRGVKDDQSVRDARPPPPDVFSGPLQTTAGADAQAGALALTVASTSRFAMGDSIGVYAGGDLFRVAIASVVDSTHVTLATRLPGLVASGSVVTNYSKITAPRIE